MQAYRPARAPAVLRVFSSLGLAGVSKSPGADGGGRDEVEEAMKEAESDANRHGEPALAPGQAPGLVFCFDLDNCAVSDLLWTITSVVKIIQYLLILSNDSHNHKRYDLL